MRGIFNSWSHLCTLFPVVWEWFFVRAFTWEASWTNSAPAGAWFLKSSGEFPPPLFVLAQVFRESQEYMWFLLVQKTETSGEDMNDLLAQFSRRKVSDSSFWTEILSIMCWSREQMHTQSHKIQLKTAGDGQSCCLIWPFSLPAYGGAS